MTTETKRVRYDVACDACHKQFPIIVDTQPGKAGTTEKDLECPFCGAAITVNFPHVFRQEDPILRGIRKPG